MKKYIWLFSVLLLTNILISPALASDTFEEYTKVIYIDQLKQVGSAYERGKKVMEFPVLTGDDETTTDPGTYLVRVKDENYYSRKYQTPMPYSIFFNYTTRSSDSRRTGTAAEEENRISHPWLRARGGALHEAVI